jgi:predicted permease
MFNAMYAVRTLRRSPIVTVIGVLTLALGIGSNAAIFSLFNQILVRALPVAQPGRLVNLGAPGPKPGLQSCSRAGYCDEVFSYPMFRDLERVQTVFTGIAAHRQFSVSLAYRGQTLSGEGLLVSGSYFPVLGIQPASGRLISPADDRAIDESPVVVLSHEYWRTRFSGNPNVVNEKLIVNGQNLTIIGVAPEGFGGTTIGLKPLVFVPITLGRRVQPNFYDFASRLEYWAYLFARLKPEIEIDQARAGLDVQYNAILNEVEAPLQPNMTAQMLSEFKQRKITVEVGAHGQSLVHREATLPLTFLFGVTILVLFIACANIANLLLARGAARSTEMAVRLSIGASRRQLITQLLAESTLLATLGGLAGVFVAYWTLRLMVAMLANDIVSAIPFAIDRPVLLFSAALTLGTGFLLGLYPAAHSSRPDLLTGLKAETSQGGSVRTASRFRISLAIAQIALSVVLLVGAGLFTRSLFNVSRVDLGFNIDRLVTFRVSPQLNGYSAARSRMLFDQIEKEIAALPGVTAVTASTVPVLTGSDSYSYVLMEGMPAGGPDIDSVSLLNQVGSGYFKTMGMPLLAGREFTPTDTLGFPARAIVNEAFAKKFNRGENPVGKRMGTEFGGVPNIDIIGLVKDAKYNTAKYDVPPLFFRPYRQDDSVGRMTFYARTSSPEKLLTDIPKTIARLDPDLPVESLRTMSQQFRDNVFVDRFISHLSMAFAILASLLAMVGIYGVLAYTVEQRRREIGVRMALGADPKRVRAMILRRIAFMTFAGVLIGLPAALLIGRFAEGLLYDLRGHDPVVVISATVTVMISALAAGFIPAYRASRIDPIRALRHE